MRSTVVVLILMTALTAGAGEVLLGAAGKTRHRIVVQDAYADARIGASVKQAAELLQRAFQENGIALEIVPEAQVEDTRPGIYLGKTRFALRAGVDFDAMEGWTYVFRVNGRSLIIAGNDRPDPIPLEKRRRREARFGGIPLLGTLKGVTEFLYRYVGVRFLCPGEHGIEFLPTPVIYVPGDLDVVKRTHARDIEVSKSRDIYFIANGLEPSPTTVSSYGHYHHTALSAEAYGDAHPEYFVCHSRRRDNRSKHFCFSNREVRELIYRKVLEDCDTGYDIVEMGQNDGFRPCGCHACRVLYGAFPTHSSGEGLAYLGDRAWGEKLWIMHRDLAARLARDRPGKQLMVSAYSVAREPPRSIERLPANVSVQVMHPEPGIFERWRRVKPPCGYAAYTYTWGSFTPKNSIRRIRDLVQTLVDNNVRAVQVNLKPTGYGIEGVNVYVFRRMLNDPQAHDVDALFDEYINAAYREAAGPMQRFFRKLHQQLDFLPEAAAFGHRIKNPLLPFSALYTGDLVNELDNQLSRAEALPVSPAVKARLAATRFEFDYLRHIVNTVVHYHAYRLRPDEVSLDRLLSAVEARNAWIESFPKPRPSFVWYSAAGLKCPRGLNVGPLNWDTARKRAEGLTRESREPKRLRVLRAEREVTLDSPVWSNAPKHPLLPNDGAAGELQESTTFQVLYDDTNLYVRFDAGLRKELMDTYHPRGRDAEIWLQECINVCLSPSGDRSQYYYLNYEPVPNSFTDAQHGFITDPLHPRFGWNDNTWDGDWTYSTRLLPEENRWLSLAVIPFAALDAPVPAAGSAWAANFGRVHYKEEIKDSSHRNRVRIRELSVWTRKINVSRTPGDGYFGEIVFE